MADIIGFLREDATYGEKFLYKTLKQNLPSDFSVYVECPIHTRRMERFPDFIVVTNYGVIILEIKDWVQIIKADRYNVIVRTRGNQQVTYINPLTTARDFCLALQDTLKDIPGLLNEHHRLKVPWGYGVIFPNLPNSITTQLRKALGENFVLGRDDLNPDLLRARLRNLIPEGRTAALSGDQLRLIRAAINPTVLIVQSDRPAIILDQVQERLVAEPIKEEPQAQPETPMETQMDLLAEEEQSQPEDETPPEEAALVGKLSVRLVRGIAGSGKSLVLLQRAKYLASQFPDWNILVATYNRKLADRLNADLGSFDNIKATNFHRLCRALITSFTVWNLDTTLTKWISAHQDNYKIIANLSGRFIEEEIKWIKENGIKGEEEYISVVRRGRGTQTRVSRDQRLEIFTVFQAYQKYLHDANAFDWQDVPWIVMEGIREGKITPHRYDAVLIDEAQDFAPCWVQVIKQLVKSGSGSFFIADDPTQSIYRYYSWKEKGVKVVGRTRWLRIPYRNTKEIYTAAFSIIENNQSIRDQLKSEGELLNPDIDNPWMRSGPKPLLTHSSDYDTQVQSIASRVNGLMQESVPPTQIAVLAARKRQIKGLRKVIMNNAVEVDTFYQFKGMEFQHVFLVDIQDMFRDQENDEKTARSLRLMYMGMTRARENLYIYYRHHFPDALRTLRAHCDHLT